MNSSYFFQINGNWQKCILLSISDKKYYLYQIMKNATIPRESYQ
jgi:hypothetical protein